MKKGEPSRAAISASDAALAGTCTTSPRWFTSIALVGIAASLVLRYRWVCGMSWFNDRLVDRLTPRVVTPISPSLVDTNRQMQPTNNWYSNEVRGRRNFIHY